jgi:hypothetical protein
MLGGLEGNSFVFVEFEEGGGVFEVAALALGAVRLDFAEQAEGLLELAREALRVQAEGGEERDQGLGAGVLREQVGFQQRDAVEAPGSVDELLDELGFGGGGRLVLDEEAASMVFKGGAVFGRQDGGGGGQAVAQGVERGTLFTGFGARAVECWAFARLTAGRSMVRSKTGTGNTDIWSPQLGHNTRAGLRGAEAVGSG